MQQHNTNIYTVHMNMYNCKKYNTVKDWNLGAQEYITRISVELNVGLSQALVR